MSPLHARTPVKRRDLGAYLLARHPHLKLSALSTLEPLALLPPVCPWLWPSLAASQDMTSCLKAH